MRWPVISLCIIGLAVGCRRSPSPQPPPLEVELVSSTDEVGSGLPVLLLTAPTSAVRNTWTDAIVGIASATDAKGRVQVQHAPALASHARIKLHGSSSRAFAKKQLRLRLTTADGKKARLGLLGMRPAATWVLHAPYADKTLLRNVLAYGWSRAQGHWAPDTRLVELYLDDGGGTLGADDYRGVYVVVERIEVTPERLTLSDGTLFRQDNLAGDDVTFQSAAGISYRLDSSPRGASRAGHLDDLNATIDTFETALFGPEFADPERGYAAHIDVNSFVDHFLLVELTKNSDGFKKSTYFHTDRNGRIHSGPVWDYNVALRNGRLSADPTGWLSRSFQRGRSPYWPRLLQDPAFERRVRHRWQELRGGPWSTGQLIGDIDRLVTRLGDAPKRNFERWPILGERIFTNPDTSASHAEEIDKLKSWLHARLAWLDREFADPPPARPAVGPEPGDAWTHLGPARAHRPGHRWPGATGAALLAFELRLPYPKTGSARIALRLASDKRTDGGLPFDKPGAEDDALSVGLLTTAPPIRNEVAVRWRGREIFRRGLGRHIVDFGAGAKRRVEVRVVEAHAGTRLTLSIENDSGEQLGIIDALPVPGLTLGSRRLEVHDSAGTSGQGRGVDRLSLRTSDRPLR